ncbi:MAG: amidase [Sphingomonas sp. 28-66-16]|nr:MAG: amidase [Sphingomonas sp. 28-66-16]
MRSTLISLSVLTSLLMSPAAAKVPGYVGECVPFARAISGIDIHGDAWRWWQLAKGKYQRGHRPKKGAVIVFAKSPQLRVGHVAVVSRVIDSRVVMVTHANWSRIHGARGHVEQDVTLTDVSRAHDWSLVRVWFRRSHGLGTTSYRVTGFIYGKSAASPKLTGAHPDYVGSLIDVYAG